MSDPVRPNRARPGAQRCRLGIAVLVAILGWAGTPLASQAQSVDLAPLVEVHPDLATGMERAFPDYEALVRGGVQQRNGKPSRGGIVEQVKKTYDTELDESNSWSVDAIATLFDTAASASRDLDASC